LRLTQGCDSAAGGAGCLACPPNSARPGFATSDTTSGGCSCSKGYYWNTNVCVKCTDLASTNTAGKAAATDCGCPSNYFSSTDTPDTTGCQACPSNSYRNLVTVAAGETVDLKTTGITTCTCNANYWQGHRAVVLHAASWLNCRRPGGRGARSCISDWHDLATVAALLQVERSNSDLLQVPHRRCDQPNHPCQGRTGPDRLR
jgi:hypothetical protein